MSGRELTIAARVPATLRAELEEVRDELNRRGERRTDGGAIDLSVVIRRACADYVDRTLGRAAAGALGALELKPATHRNGPATERMASHAAWPGAKSQRRRALKLLERAGNDGMTGDELDVALEAKGGGVYDGRRRLSELKGGGWAEVALDVNREPVRRRTRRRQWADVYVLTGAALMRLAEERRG